MQYLGDIERTQSDIRFRFNTRTAAGVPVDGVGLAAVVYKDGSVTEITGAVTLTVPFDSRTGLVSVYVDASGASFTPGSNYSVVLSAGTVDGVSVAGVCIAEFSIEYRNTKANVIAMDTNVITASALATDAVTEIQSGLSTLDAAGVRTAIGLGSANLDTQLGDIPTVSEFNARSLPSASIATEANVNAVGTAVTARPTLAAIEASTVLAKEATVAARPTLGQIEASTVLPTKADVTNAGLL